MLEVGDALTLEPLVSDKSEKYKCKIVDMINNKIFVDYPIYIKTGKSAFLLNGMQLKGSFLSKDNNVYEFETEIVGRVKREIPMLILSYKGKESLIRVQRRQFFRIETPVDVAIQAENQEFSPFVTITQDISAGGAAIIMPDGIEISSGLIAYGLFVLPMQSGQWYYENLRCKVIRTIKGNNGKNIAPLEFIDIGEKNRQMLTRFCYERQLQISKKIGENV